MERWHKRPISAKIGDPVPKFCSHRQFMTYHILTRF
jgi:hypothetical protein